MKYNQETFLNRCEIIHDKFYDYSETVFISSNKKIDIICPKHGHFNQLAKKHLSGSGCSKCSHENHRITQHEFIERSIKIHNNKYNYELAEYINHSSKVKIICPEHGIFSQSPNNHMTHKKGCGKCNGGIKYTKETFLQKAKEIHGNKFKYNLENWTNSNNKIKMICEKGHEFSQLPVAHLRGQSCQKCKSYDRIYNNKEFIKLAKMTHFDKYDYSETEYKSSTEKILIKCVKCKDIFTQRPKNHLFGQGCPKCCNNSISKMEKSWLDYLGIHEEYRHKTVKINNKNFINFFH